MKKTVMEFRNQKIELHRIIAYSIIMGIAINIISNSLGKILNFPLWLNIIIWVGISLVIISIAQIVELCRLNSTIKYEGLFITHRNEKNRIIGIPNYKISTDMKTYFEAAFSENPAYRTIWEESGLDKLQGPHIAKKTNDSKKLLAEMIEYCVLEHFSSFINDYYNIRNITKKTIEYSGTDIPDVLLKNRFMKMFSEEPQNRAAFCNSKKSGIYKIDDKDTEPEDKGTLVFMIGSNGALYSKFELVIPKGSKVCREEDNGIEVHTKLFTMKYKFLFDGISTYVEQDFYKYYLHELSPMDYHDWKFDVQVSIKYKLSALFKFWDWKYYNWLDEYLDKLSDYCAVDNFYKNIGWRETKTFIQILKTPNFSQKTK